MTAVLFRPTPVAPSHAGGSTAGTAPERERFTAPVLLTIFVACLLTPMYFEVAGLRLTPLRLYLLFTFVPLAVKLLSGAAGRVSGPDIVLFAFSVTLVVSLLYHHGLERIGLAGITTVELLGGFLVGRILVRNEADFRLLLKLHIGLLVVLAPFALTELLTGRILLQEFFGLFSETFLKADSSTGRLGLNRVMASFEHPILYGLFASLCVAPVWMGNVGRPVKRGVAILFMVGMTFVSLSSAPLLAVAIQIALLAWWRLTGARWGLLIALATICYVTVDVLSNRTPITIMFDYVTFDPATAWTRILIWDYASAEVMRHPLMGIGLNDWLRPDWLTDSVDNFWLLVAMRHGLTGLAMLILALAWAFLAEARAKGLSPSVRSLRTGYQISLVALFFSLCTVHIWGNTSSFVFAYIGAGLWFASGGQDLTGGTRTNTSLVGVATQDGLRTSAGRQLSFGRSGRGRPDLPHTRFAPVRRTNDTED